MKLKLIALIAIACLSAIAQAPPPLPFTPNTLPTMIGGGVTYNQLGSPQISFWAAGIEPVSDKAGMYLNQTVDLLPARVFDSASGRTIYTLQGTLRAGACKTLRPFTGNSVPKDMVLICGDAGVALSQASSSGASLNVSVTSAFGLPYVHQFNAHWASIVELRGVWVPTLGSKGAWNLIPEIGIVFKP